MNRMTGLAVLSLLIALAGCKGNGRSTGGNEKTTVKGEGDRQLTLSPPGGVTVHRGDVAEVKIEVERKDVAGSLSVDFDDLPEGVSVVNKDKKIEGDSETYSLKADTDAALVENHQAKVTVKGPDRMAATQTLRVTVKQRAPE
jgi:hypothetical protein